MNKLHTIIFSSLFLCSIYVQAYQAFSTGNNVIIRNGQVISSTNTVTGSGIIKSQTRNLNSFSGIRLHIPAEVKIIKGTQPKCTISADDNILPIITTNVRSNILTIASNKNFSSANQVTITITAPQLSKLFMTASGNVVIEGVQENSLEIVLGGAINVQATGKVRTLTVRLDGTGDMDLDNLQVHAADVSLNGAGTIRIFATGTFSGLIQGSGDIWVRGNPQILRSTVYGAGQITPIP